MAEGRTVYFCASLNQYFDKLPFLPLLYPVCWHVDRFSDVRADKWCMSSCSVMLKVSFAYFGPTQCRAKFPVWELLAYAKQSLMYANDVWRFSKEPWVTKACRMATRELLSQPIVLSKRFKTPSQTPQRVASGFSEVLTPLREVCKGRNQWPSEGPALDLGHQWG